MAQHKLENEFRNQLNNREIQPSAHAWDRLDAMLNEAENKKVVPVRKLNWLYIAAGFIGLLLLGTMFFTLVDDTAKTPERVVIEPKNNQPTTTPEEKRIESFQITKQNSEVVVENQKPTQKKENKPRLDPLASIQTTNNPIASNNTEVQTINHQSNHHNQNPNLEKAPVNVDELLVSATPDSKPKSKKPALKVDPNSLLSQVDGELELSFREKVIHAVGKNYQKVKVAVADRNQE